MAASTPARSEETEAADARLGDGANCNIWRGVSRTSPHAAVVIAAACKYTAATPAMRPECNCAVAPPTRVSRCAIGNPGETHGQAYPGRPRPAARSHRQMARGVCGGAFRARGRGLGVVLDGIRRSHQRRCAASKDPSIPEDRLELIMPKRITSVVLTSIIASSI